MNIAKYHIVGRLVADPEVKEINGVGRLTKVCVAVNTKSGGEERASFFDLQGWDKMSDMLGQLKKGQEAYFDGDFIMDEFPAKNASGEEITNKDGKKIMRRVVKFTVWGMRYGVGGEPKKKVAEEPVTVTPDDDDDDVPF